VRAFPLSKMGFDSQMHLKMLCFGLQLYTASLLVFHYYCVSHFHQNSFKLPTVDARVSLINLVYGKLSRSLQKYTNRRASDGSIGGACSK
jgi:hypothetical protein